MEGEDRHFLIFPDCSAEFLLNVADTGRESI
jgi:hypothetical protein